MQCVFLRMKGVNTGHDVSSLVLRRGGDGNREADERSHIPGGLQERRLISSHQHIFTAQTVTFRMETLCFLNLLVHVQILEHSCFIYLLLLKCKCVFELLGFVVFYTCSSHLRDSFFLVLFSGSDLSENVPHF